MLTWTTIRIQEFCIEFLPYKGICKNFTSNSITNDYNA